MSKTGKARHEGRPGWRYAFLGPTESGKTTSAVRFAKEWMNVHTDGLVFANMKIYNGDVDREGNRLPEERWRPIRDFDKGVKAAHSAGKKVPVLLIMDQFGQWVNSLPGYTDNKILKSMLELAQSLTKMNLEFIYTDQWPRNVHTRVRTNMNRAFLPSYDPNVDKVEYFSWPGIDELIARDEMSRQGPFHFQASQYWPFFDTQELLTAKLPKFHTEKETEKIVRWSGKFKKPIPVDKGLTDFLHYYLMERGLNWSSGQIGAVRHALRERYGDSEEKGTGKDKAGD